MPLFFDLETFGNLKSITKNFPTFRFSSCCY